MKSLYFLLFISAFLLYSAYTKGMGSYLSQWKLVVALALALIVGAYWLYDKIKGNRR